MKKDKTKKVILSPTAALLFSYGFVVIVQLLQNSNPFGITTLILGTSILLIVLLVSIIFNTMFSSIANKPVTQLKKKLIPSFLLFTLLTLIISFIIYFSGVYILYRIEGWDTSKFITHIFKTQFTGGLISVAIGVLISSVAFFYAIWRQAVDREQKLREENLQYKYRNLKAQVNPHFLFNSLNTLSELIYEDTKKADNYIQKLAGIYRYILDNEEKDLIPLSEEINFMQQHFDLQKERDGDKIQLDIDIKNAGNYKIIPISLQILVENALKHNAASTESPLMIKIWDNNNYILVENNVQRKSVLNNSPGTGLSNLSKRVQLITGKEMNVQEENSRFTVQLPIVNSIE